MKNEKKKAILKTIRREIAKINDLDILAGEFNSYITDYDTIEINLNIKFMESLK